ncbi:ATP-binding protein [Mucilaginibacter sp.]|uniref:ATP-binding protein n=1 Tax=Mucilaginibacter sp. TaxID=1882438 RepID=UPI002841A595|nr:ATP-binding protein [Mucilaginibacter sp.]MDR3696477.1 ATP-binding protein [Mucilaginibacter sp.]
MMDKLKESEESALIKALKELAFQKEEKEKLAAELVVAREELAFQKEEKGKRAAELGIANKELVFQDEEKGKRAAELGIANKELAFQDEEKEKRADELIIANIELAFQDEEKSKRAAELGIANMELAFQDEEKEKRAAELIIANLELVFQNDEKEKRALELGIANLELAFQDEEKEKRAAELIIANEELVFQNDEKEKRAAEFSIANKELIFQNEEKEKRAAELIIANKELVFQNEEKEKRAAELIIANKELVFQNDEKEKRAAELIIANKELAFQNDEKEKRAGELGIANKELAFQNNEKEKREIANKELEEAKSKAESATQIAEEAVKAKQQFLSNMSHEIRTPMNAIIGFTKVMLKTDLSAKQQEYLTAIKISGDALIVLINDILDLAKVEAGKMSFEKTPFKLAASISSMLHLFETKIQEKNLKLVKEYDSNIPDVLVGDPVRLHQIILNLVSNAVKFTANGIITVSVCQMENEAQDNVSIKFSVTDTGIGIAENTLDRIFENFQQASSGTSRLFGGTGLGLAIVKQLVEQQGGTISVKSRIDEGSTFSFVLNFQKTKAKAELERGIVELDNEIKNMKVLVVEDIALNQLLMKTFLDDFGFECDIAPNGRVAIEKLSQKTAGTTKPYDIILMDLQMPEMNGFEATEYIRDKMNLKIPIIALTADVTTVDLAKCKAVGMNDYIAKPVDERLLYSKIVEFVKKPAAQPTGINGDKKVAGDNEPFGTPAGEAAAALKCINLEYLLRRTKSNPKLMIEMISLYLEQTPPLVSTMKQGLQQKNWSLLQSAAHKIIPSFSIMGISADAEDMAKKVQESARMLARAETDKNDESRPANIHPNTSLVNSLEMYNLVLQIEKVCSQACNELEKELTAIKTSKDESQK